MWVLWRGLISQTKCAPFYDFVTMAHPVILIWPTSTYRCMCVYGNILLAISLWTGSWVDAKLNGNRFEERVWIEFSTLGLNTFVSNEMYRVLNVTSVYATIPCLNSYRLFDFWNGNRILFNQPPYYRWKIRRDLFATVPRPLAVISYYLVYSNLKVSGCLIEL